MGIRARISLMAALATIAFAGSAAAGGVKQIGSIQPPGEPSNQFSTGFVDQKTGLYYWTDRSNKAVNIIDTKTDQFLMRVTGFTGVQKSGDLNGPNGVVTVNDSSEAWVTDGDSTVKIIDMKSGQIVATISTGGKKRANEMAYDPDHQVVIVTNPNDEPPFLTLISAKPGHEIIGKILMPEATEAIERAVYYAPRGTFYVNIPVLNHEHAKGGLAEVDPRTAKIVNMHLIENCNPHSVSLAADSLMFIGCAAGAKDTHLDKPLMAVFDAQTGKITATIEGIGGAGQTAVNPNAGHYYAAANNNPGGPAFGVMDSKTNTLVQKMPTWTGTHSVAVSLQNNHLYLPTRGNAGPCGGCVLIFAPE
jgi:DNA-binding beta-propeller fold protein YncE